MEEEEEEEAAAEVVEEEAWREECPSLPPIPPPAPPRVEGWKVQALSSAATRAFSLTLAASSRACFFMAAN